MWEDSSASSHSDDLILKFCTLTIAMLAMQTEREGGTGGQVYLLRHGRSEISSLSSALSSMLAMQAEREGGRSTFFDRVALKSLPHPLPSHAFHPVTLKPLGIVRYACHPC